MNEENYCQICQLPKLISAVDDLIRKMTRLVTISRRTKLEMTDNPRLHLNPCSICGVVLTRYGVCASCESKSNGHSETL